MSENDVGREERSGPVSTTTEFDKVMATRGRTEKFQAFLDDLESNERYRNRRKQRLGLNYSTAR